MRHDNLISKVEKRVHSQALFSPMDAPLQGLETPKYHLYATLGLRILLRFVALAFLPVVIVGRVATLCALCALTRALCYWDPDTVFAALQLFVAAFTFTAYARVVRAFIDPDLPPYAVHDTFVAIATHVFIGSSVSAFIALYLFLWDFCSSQLFILFVCVVCFGGVTSARIIFPLADEPQHAARIAKKIYNVVVFDVAAMCAIYGYIRLFEEGYDLEGALLALQPTFRYDYLIEHYLLPLITKIDLAAQQAGAAIAEYVSVVVSGAADTLHAYEDVKQAVLLVCSLLVVAGLVALVALYGLIASTALPVLIRGLYHFSRAFLALYDAASDFLNNHSLECIIRAYGALCATTPATFACLLLAGVVMTEFYDVQISQSKKYPWT